MTKSHGPPVPPAGRSNKGPGGHPGGAGGKPQHERRPENLAEQGRQGNIKQNTTNKGHQQDR
ncbi:MAG: hypothetical protein ACREFQ_02070 [Stellaceae bacterium]